ncbi:MAG: dihydrofolate reductase [Bacteroidia bacterium]
MKISIVVAADEKNGIGKDNKLLCHLPADLKYFKQLTTGHYILMGRKTFESIGKPLPNRTNLVISKTVIEINGCHVFKTIEDAITYAKENNQNELFIIGGDSIYLQCLNIADTVYLTRIKHVFEADSFFPEIDERKWIMKKNNCFGIDEKNKFEYCFQVFEKLTI